MPVAFDTSGMEQYDERTWFCPRSGDQVSLTYIDLVPDLPAPLDDLPLLRHRLALETAEIGALIEAHVVMIDSVPALYQLLKLPIPDRDSGQAFIAAFTVPKATCSVVLRIQCAEGETTGLRESAVIAQVGPEAFVRPHPYAPALEGRLPWHVGDEERWDGRFPEHPLSRARVWANKTVNTARIDRSFAQLPPFTPDGPGPNDHTDFHAPVERPALPPASSSRSSSSSSSRSKKNAGKQPSGAHHRPDPKPMDVPDLEAPALQESTSQLAAQPAETPKSRRASRHAKAEAPPPAARRSKLDSKSAWQLPPTDSEPAPDTIGARAFRTRRAADEEANSRSSTHRMTPSDELKAQAPRGADASSRIVSPNSTPPPFPLGAAEIAGDRRVTPPNDARPFPGAGRADAFPEAAQGGGRVVPNSASARSGTFPPVAPGNGAFPDAAPGPDRAHPGSGPGVTGARLFPDASPSAFPNGSPGTAGARPGAFPDASPPAGLVQPGAFPNGSPGTPGAFPDGSPSAANARSGTFPGTSQSTTDARPGTFPDGSPNSANARPGTFPDSSPGTTGARPGAFPDGSPATANARPGAFPDGSPSAANARSGAFPDASQSTTDARPGTFPDGSPNSANARPGTFADGSPAAANARPGAFPDAASGAFPGAFPDASPGPARPGGTPENTGGHAFPDSSPAAANGRPGATAFPGAGHPGAPGNTGARPDGFHQALPGSAGAFTDGAPGARPGAFPEMVPGNAGGRPGEFPNGAPASAGPGAAPAPGRIQPGGFPDGSPNATGTRFPQVNPGNVRPDGFPDSPAQARPGSFPDSPANGRPGQFPDPSLEITAATPGGFPELNGHPGPASTRSGVFPGVSPDAVTARPGALPQLPPATGNGRPEISPRELNSYPHTQAPRFPGVTPNGYPTAIPDSASARSGTFPAATPEVPPGQAGAFPGGRPGRFPELPPVRELPPATGAANGNPVASGTFPAVSPGNGAAPAGFVEIAPDQPAGNPFRDNSLDTTNAHPPSAVSRPVASPGAYPPGIADPIGSPQAAGIQPPGQLSPPMPRTGEPPVGHGDVMHTVLIGLPIGGYVPLWHENAVSYWRLTDPAGVRTRLGIGVESRTEIDNRRFREAGLFTPERNTLFLTDRFRNGQGNLGGASTQLVPATEDEAYRAATDKAMSEFYSWLGDVVVAAGQRGEYVAIETGGWHVPVTPVVLIMLRTDGREWHSVVETSPVPHGAPVWRDQQPVDGDTQLLASPATDRTMRAAGLLTRFAVSTWPMHPFQLGLSFGPNPTLGDGPTR